MTEKNPLSDCTETQETLSKESSITKLDQKKWNEKGQGKPGRSEPTPKAGKDPAALRLSHRYERLEVEVTEETDTPQTSPARERGRCSSSPKFKPPS